MRMRVGMLAHTQHVVPSAHSLGRTVVFTGIATHLGDESPRHFTPFLAEHVEVVHGIGRKTPLGSSLVSESSWYALLLKSSPVHASKSWKLTPCHPRPRYSLPLGARRDRSPASLLLLLVVVVPPRCGRSDPRPLRASILDGGGGWGGKRDQDRDQRCVFSWFPRTRHDGHELLEEHVHRWHLPRGAFFAILALVSYGDFLLSLFFSYHFSRLLVVCHVLTRYLREVRSPVQESLRALYIPSNG